MKTKQEKQWSNLAYFLITICIILLLFLGVIGLRNNILNMERDYYKTQMLSFCEMDKTLTSILVKYAPEVPQLEQDCEYWVIDYEGAKK